MRAIEGGGADRTGGGACSGGRVFGGARGSSESVEEDDPAPGAGAGAEFVGSWVGEWADPVVNQNGISMLTLAKGGTLTGTVKHLTLGLAGTATGAIQPTGAFAYTYSYPGQVYTAKGTCTVGNNGHLLCNTTQYDTSGTAFGSNVIDFVKQ